MVQCRGVPVEVIVGTGLALLVGLVMGLIGAGGSILTVPILVYIVGIDVIPATAYSLLLVGATAAAGAVDYWRRGLVDVAVATRFAVPALVAVFAVRRFVIPALPDVLGEWRGFSLTADLALMILFATVMALSALVMIRPSSTAATISAAGADESTASNEATVENTHRPWWRPLIEGVGVGAVTGLIGAGGGFAIVLALVVWGRLPMRMAVGTSLTIIAAKSLFGFVGDLGKATSFDWGLVAPFVGLALIGVLLGGRIASGVPATTLRAVFGWFMLAAATAIVAAEVVGALAASSATPGAGMA